MPTAELRYFQHAIRWVREPDHAKDSADFAEVARCYFTFLPAPCFPTSARFGCSAGGRLTRTYHT